MPSSSKTFAAAYALMETALAEGRVEQALSECRIAKLKAAAELERSGRFDEASELIAEVRAEHEKLADAER